MQIKVKKTEEPTVEYDMANDPALQNNYGDDEEDLSYLSESDKKLMSLHKSLLEVYGENVAPTLSQLEGWKKRHDNIYVSNVSNNNKEIYVWRVLRRYEYKELKEGDIRDPESFNEMIVEKCLLFPTYSFTFRNSSVAGVITTLGAQMSYKSGFVSEQEALNLIYIS